MKTYKEFNESIYQLVMDVFTWNFQKLVAWCDVLVSYSDEVSKSRLLKKNRVIKRPIETQAFYQKMNINVKNIIFLV